jgi:hypothetical protein
MGRAQRASDHWEATGRPLVRDWDATAAGCATWWTAD